MAVKFQQLSTWKAGGSLINDRHTNDEDNGLYSRPATAGNKEAGIVVGGSISPGVAPSGTVSSCTEEYNGATDSWGSAASHLFSFKGAIAVGSQNAVLNAYVNAVPYNPSPSITSGASGIPNGTTAFNVIDGHTSDEHTTTGGSSNLGSPSSFLGKGRLATKYDGTSWSTTVKVINGAPGFSYGVGCCTFSGGDLGAAVGTQNSAAYFGGELGHPGGSGGGRGHYNLFTNQYNGTGWDGNQPPLVGRGGGSAIGSSMNDAKLLGGATHKPSFGVMGGYDCGAKLNVGNAYGNTTSHGYTITGSNQYSEVCVPGGLCSDSDITAGFGTHGTYVGTYSCVEDYDGSTWSTGTPLLLPRTLGAASGTSNDGILWGGAWLQGQTATGKNAAGNSTYKLPRLNSTTLCCILGADHWNGSTWTSDSANIISSYVCFGLAGNGDNSSNTVNYCMPYHGGRVGIRGNGNSSNDLLSVDGVQSWFWEDAGTLYDNLCSGPYPSSGRVKHPVGENSACIYDLYNTAPVVSLAPSFGRTIHGGVCGHDYKGSLVREIATSKLSGVHFGPKLNKNGLSFYSDIGNCKNLFTNDYINPIWDNSPEERQGRIAHNCIINRAPNNEQSNWKMRDGELSGWAVAPGRTSVDRNYAVSAGCTTSTLLFGGSAPTNGRSDGEVYNGTSWSVKGATLPVTICMGSATGKDENDMLITGVGRACPISPAPATPFAPGDSYQQSFKLEGDTWSVSGASPVRMSNCGNGLAGHANSAIGLGLVGEINETYWGPYDSGKTLIYDGTSWSSDEAKMPLAVHSKGALAGKVNSALLVGGECSVLNSFSSDKYWTSTGLQTGVETFDGTAWEFTAQYPSNIGGEILNSVGPNNQCVMSFGNTSHVTTMWDGVSFKQCGPTIRWNSVNSPYQAGYIAQAQSTGNTTSNSANSALSIPSITYGTDTYDSNMSQRQGVQEWINVNVRDGAGDFHFSEHSGSVLQPTGSIDGKGQLLNHYGKIDPNYPDKNIYMAISSGSLQTDRYFSTTSATVGSVWSTNSGLINTRCCFDMGGSMNSALVVGGITGLSGAVGTAKSCTEQYNGITWEAGAADGGIRAGTSQSPTNCAIGYLNGANRAGIWQHTVTGCTADSVTVHGGACPMASPGDNIETPAAGMTADALEWSGYNWVEGPSMNNPRVGMAGAGTSQTAVLFGGGYHCARTVASMESLACTEEYNGKAYSAGGAMIETVCQGAGAGSQNSAVGFGGCCQVGGTMTGYSAISQEYDGTSWSNSAGLNNPRWGLAGSGTQNSAIAIGGSCRLDSDSTSLHQCVEEYDGTSWSNKAALPQSACEASVGNSSKSALSVGTSVFSNKYMDNTEVNRARKRVVTHASGGATISMWVRLPYADPVEASNEFNNKTYLFANADIDKNTSITFNDRDGDTMRGRAGMRLLRHNGKLRLEWTNFLGSANEADTAFDASGNNLVTSFWASDENQLSDTSLWYNIVAMTDFSRTAANNRMYVNGTLIANTAGVDNKTGGGLYDYESIIYPENDSARMTVGNWNGRNYSFDFAQVMFYDRLLSNVEVHQNFNSFRFRFI